MVTRKPRLEFRHFWIRKKSVSAYHDQILSRKAEYIKSWKDLKSVSGVWTSWNVRQLGTRASASTPTFAEDCLRGSQVPIADDEVATALYSQNKITFKAHLRQQSGRTCCCEECPEVLAALKRWINFACVNDGVSIKPRTRSGIEVLRLIYEHADNTRSVLGSVTAECEHNVVFVAQHLPSGQPLKQSVNANWMCEFNLCQAATYIDEMDHKGDKEAEIHLILRSSTLPF